MDVGINGRRPGTTRLTYNEANPLRRTFPPPKRSDPREPNYPPERLSVFQVSIA